MGEIAEAMLDGTLCESCGEYLGSDAGFAQYCAACGGSDNSFKLGVTRAAKPHACGQCGKRFWQAAHRDQHCRDVKHRKV